MEDPKKADIRELLKIFWSMRENWTNNAYSKHRKFWTLCRVDLSQENIINNAFNSFLVTCMFQVIRKMAGVLPYTTTLDGWYILHTTTHKCGLLHEAIQISYGDYDYLCRDQQKHGSNNVEYMRIWM